jgi:hypothetical protein
MLRLGLLLLVLSFVLPMIMPVQSRITTILYYAGAGIVIFQLSMIMLDKGVEGVVKTVGFR